ncbi:hypothetical protein HGRIS_008877 [Hohenbuehelia grisea]|uniref:Uncharacterized protein n=1 Tax=Hohenbuehelia grisea TaxID=104357 RepID=A0ABR3IZK1_9AGAR
MSLVAFLALSLLLSTVRAANDWSTPCFNHTCTYHLPKDGPGRGTLKLWGPPGTISDITPSAGWEIIDCDPSKLDQEIRIVCRDDESCEHLHSHGGPEGKIVRLPESCGKMAFARIKRSWVHDNQRIPRHIARSLGKRSPVVLGKSITHEIADADTQNIMFEAIGTTAQAEKGVYSASNGTKGAAALRPPTKASSADRPYPTTTAGQLLEMLKLWKWHIGNVADDVEEFAGDIVDSIREAASEAAGFFATLLFKLNGKNVEKVVHIHPRFPETTIGSVEVDCADSTTKTELSGHADGDIVVMVGVHMRGSLDGTMERAEAYVQMDGHISGGINLQANFNGRFGPFETTLFGQGLPLLSFGSIFNVGPKFDVIGMVEADLDLRADLKYDFEYDMNNLRLSFPPDKGRSDFSPKVPSSSLKLRADETIHASGQLSAHIIPRLTVTFGLTGNLKATMFVAADASVAASFNLDANVKTTYGSKNSTHPKLPAPNGSSLSISSSTAEPSGTSSVVEDVASSVPVTDAASSTISADGDRASSTSTPDGVHSRSNAPESSASSSSSTLPAPTESVHALKYHKGLPRRMLRSKRGLNSSPITHPDRSLTPLPMPVAGPSVRKGIPDLQTTFGTISKETATACVYAQPGLKIIAGMDADATILNIVGLLGFEAKIIKSMTLFTVPLKPFSLAAGNSQCPGGSSEPLATADVSLERRNLSPRPRSFIAPTCAISASVLGLDTLANTLIDENVPGRLQPLAKQFLRYTMQKNDGAAIPGPNVAVEDKPKAQSNPEVPGELITLDDK